MADFRLGLIQGSTGTPASQDESKTLDLVINLGPESIGNPEGIWGRFRKAAFKNSKTVAVPTKGIKEDIKNACGAAAKGLSLLDSDYSLIGDFVFSSRGKEEKGDLNPRRLRLETSISGAHFLPLEWLAFADIRNSDGLSLSQISDLLPYRGYPLEKDDAGKADCYWAKGLGVTPVDRLRILVIADGPVKSDPPVFSQADIDAVKTSVAYLEEKICYGSPIESIRLITGKGKDDIKDVLNPRSKSGGSRHGDWNVIVWIGHIPAGDDGKVTLTAGTGGECWSAEDFAKDISLARDLRLVMLLGCQSSHYIAPALVKRGIPAVVANQTPVHTGDMAKWMTDFIEELAEQGRIDLAFLAMRDGLEAWERGIPVLHLRGERFRLLLDKSKEGIRTQRLIALAREKRKVYEDIRLPNNESIRRDRLGISRSVAYDESESSNKSDRSGENGRPGREATRHVENESWLMEKLCTPPAGDTPLRIGILGGAGLGKSVLLQGLTAALSDRFLRDPEEAALPIFASLRDAVFEACPGNGPDDPLRGLFGKDSKLNLCALTQLEGKKYCILLDGLDENANLSTNHEWLDAFKPAAGALGRCSSVISSRPEAVSNTGLPHFGAENRKRGGIMELEPLKPEEIETYVRDYFADKQGAGKPQVARDRITEALRTSSSLALAASHPFLLALLCEIALQDESGHLPETGTELMESSILRLANLRLARRVEEPEDRYSEWHVCLFAALAFAQQCKISALNLDTLWPLDGDMRLSEDEALLAIDVLLESDGELKTQLERRHGEVYASKMLRFLGRSGGLLRQQKDVKDEPYVDFVDVRVREFLAGKHLAYLADRYGWDGPCVAFPKATFRGFKPDEGNASVIDFVLTWMFHPKQVWHAPFEHMAALADDPLPLIRKLNKNGRRARDPLGFHLALAIRCTAAIGRRRLGTWSQEPGNTIIRDIVNRFGELVIYQLGEEPIRSSLPFLESIPAAVKEMTEWLPPDESLTALLIRNGCRMRGILMRIAEKFREDAEECWAGEAWASSRDPETFSYGGGDHDYDSTYNEGASGSLVRHSCSLAFGRLRDYGITHASDASDYLEYATNIRAIFKSIALGRGHPFPDGDVEGQPRFPAAIHWVNDGYPIPGEGVERVGGGKRVSEAARASSVHEPLGVIDEELLGEILGELRSDDRETRLAGLKKLDLFSAPNDFDNTIPFKLWPFLITEVIPHCGGLEFSENDLFGAAVEYCMSGKCKIWWRPEGLADLIYATVMVGGDEAGALAIDAARTIGPKVAASPDMLDLMGAVIGSGRSGISKSQIAAAGLVASLGDLAATPDILDGLATMLDSGERQGVFAAAFAVTQMGNAAASDGVLAALRKMAILPRPVLGTDYLLDKETGEIQVLNKSAFRSPEFRVVCAATLVGISPGYDAPELVNNLIYRLEVGEPLPRDKWLEKCRYQRQEWEILNACAPYMGGDPRILRAMAVALSRLARLQPNRLKRAGDQGASDVHFGLHVSGFGRCQGYWSWMDALCNAVDDLDSLAIENERIFINCEQTCWYALKGDWKFIARLLRMLKTHARKCRAGRCRIISEEP